MTPANEKLAEQLHSVPQQLVLAMCGKRRTVELQRIRERWGIPLDGRRADLFDVLKAFVDFLTQHGDMLSMILTEAEDDAEGPLAVQLLRARIAKTQADARAADLRNEIKEGRLCDVSQVRTLLNCMVARFHRACDQAQRKWGADGFEFFESLSDGIAADIREHWGSVDDFGQTENAGFNYVAVK